MIRLISSSRSLVLGLILASAGTVACGGGGADKIVGVTPGNGGGTGGTVAVGSVVLGSTTASIQRGGSVTLTASARDASGNALSGRTITWATSDANIAVVSSSGVVTGMGPGTATITATSEGKAASAMVTVTAPPVAVVASVSLSAASPVSLLVGVVDSTTLGSATVAATTKDASGNVLTGRVVTWSSDASSIATVSSTGVIKAVAAGSATITATSEGKSAAVTVTVVRPPVAQITVTPSSATVKVGASVTVSVILLDAQGHSLTGRLGGLDYDSAIVTVVGESITGKAAGSTAVTYSSEGKKGAVTVTVVP
ncbi:MAG: Ig-like domain-containing protein [Gemmatimonadaceae bacterium]